jgi:deoxyribonuclease V
VHEAAIPEGITEREARELQRKLAPLVRQEPLDVEAVRLVAGADISFDKTPGGQAETPVCAGFVTLRLPELTLQEWSGVRTVAHFPYIPGLLSFREVPPLLEAWADLQERPDALLADGQGLAHPRRFGLACHLGLLLDLPTVGVAKSLLVGKHGPVPEEAGGWAPLEDRGEVVGAALRTWPGVSPVYVSIGHRIDLPGAVALVMRCLGHVRVPETTRYAHQYVNDLRRNSDFPLHLPSLR